MLCSVNVFALETLPGSEEGISSWHTSLYFDNSGQQENNILIHNGTLEVINIALHVGTSVPFPMTRSVNVLVAYKKRIYFCDMGRVHFYVL